MSRRQPDPNEINPATGRPRRDDAQLREVCKREDKKADEAIALTERLYQERIGRLNVHLN